MTVPVFVSSAAATDQPASACPLCSSDGGVLIAHSKSWRIVRAADQPDFPLTYRVIWNSHMAEFTDLSAAEQLTCMQVVAAVESAMREHLHPDKINLAELGNVVPHLHWHVIARYRWDSRFPAPIWGEPQREVPSENWQRFQEAQACLEKMLSRLVDDRSKESITHG